MIRTGYAAASASMVLLTGLTAWNPPQPRLLWNASASVPIGLYRLHVGAAPRCGDLAAVMPPAPLAQLLAERHYLPSGLPLLKIVAARAGAVVCRNGAAVTIGGQRAAVARARDGHGRILPTWRGCRTLNAGTLFLLNAAPDSFDGRYFGPIFARGVIGRATPLLIRPSPRARHRWCGIDGGGCSTLFKPKATKGHSTCRLAALPRSKTAFPGGSRP